LPLARYPNVYDAAFSWDRSREALTFLRVAALVSGRQPRSAVELACGTGTLTRVWASHGVASYGVDRSMPALARARKLADGLVPSGHWVLGDLRTFRLARPVDLAVVPLDSLGYLVESEDLVAFFHSARRCLAPGGVLAVDLTLHPEVGGPLRLQNAWEVSLRPAGRLTVRWRSRGRTWGRPRRRWEVASFAVGLPKGVRQVFWEAEPHAVLSAPELADLTDEAGGFGPMWVFSNAAHRGASERFHRISSWRRAAGPRLVAWPRM
jgi:SAM-dependent methyltransferase